MSGCPLLCRIDRKHAVRVVGLDYLHILTSRDAHIQPAATGVREWCIDVDMATSANLKIQGVI